MQNFSVGRELIGLFLYLNLWTVCCRDRDRERPPSRNTEDYKRNVYRDREYGRPNDRYERPRSRNGKIAYGKCSKTSKLNVGYQGWNSQNVCQNSKQGRP